MKAQAWTGQCAGSQVSLQDSRQAHQGTLLLEIVHDLLQLLHAFILLVGPLAGAALPLCAIVKDLSGTLTSSLISHSTPHERWSTQFRVGAPCLPALHASASSLPQQASSVQGMALHRREMSMPLARAMEASKRCIWSSRPSLCCRSVFSSWPTPALAACAAQPANK